MFSIEFCELKKELGNNIRKILRDSTKFTFCRVSPSNAFKVEKVSRLN